MRKGAQKIQRASTVLHHLDPGTYPEPGSWAQSLQTQTEITIRTLVEHTFELSARRRPGHAIVFIIDEVGQYVARSADKIENLRAVVEHFGQESKNRVLNNQAVAPVWVIVTSQEKLDEVVAAIDDKRVELAKLQDRFYHRIDMAPADIREVATKRVLAKKPEADALLRRAYQKSAGQLKTHIQPERSQKFTFDVSEDDFVQFYPYLPHFIELSIDIVSGMRLQAGAPRHIGGSNRTIIKQAYEMLVSDRTRMADAPIGTLVTLDKIYELVEGNLPSERQRDITTIMQTWPEDPWPARVAKAITLLEYVRGLPRTEKNLAALLYDSLDAPSPLPEVQRAVSLLEGEFIRQTEEGWKLLTAQEKSWTAERDSLNPTPKERHDIWEKSLREIFGEARMSTYRYKGRAFRIGVTWSGRTIANGQEILLELQVCDNPQDFASECEEVRKDSRQAKDRVFWVMSTTDEIDDLVVEIYRSRSMVSKYEQLRAQARITADESASLASEKLQAIRLEDRLKSLLTAAFQQGSGFYGGVEKPGPDLGRTAPEILKAMLDYAVPRLYPKLDMGLYSLRGKEAEEILKAANLNGLSQVFYETQGGMGLVSFEGDKPVIHLQAPLIREVLGYLQGEHTYGNKVTGRALENHFGSLPYGWDRQVVVVVMATLLRGGAIEVTYQGRRFRNHLEPQVRTVFTGTNAFRSASFAPRKAPDLKTLVEAVRRYEALTGEEVDVDETAIAQAFQDLARDEMDALKSAIAIAKANQVPQPVLDVLEEYRNTLLAVLQGASDDVVNILAGEGKSFQDIRSQVGAIRDSLEGDGLERLHRLRFVLHQIWPLLEGRIQDGELQEIVSTLQDFLNNGSYYRFPAQVESGIEKIITVYRKLYRTQHEARRIAYQEAVDFVKGLPDWSFLANELLAETSEKQIESASLQLTNELLDEIIEPLTSRICVERDDLAFSRVETCQMCQDSLPLLEADLAAVTARREQVIAKIQAMRAPKEKFERVRVAEIIGGYQALETKEEVEKALEQLKEYLLKLIDSGIRVILE
ncbi:BREX system P-loop protein BrxC [Candidatus Parcubacteria bacterium]|nr:MAG: BREX system P-loop protein BrxC [Candidatus Parcubacteria bacterium]